MTTTTPPTASQVDLDTCERVRLALLASRVTQPTVADWIGASRASVQRRVNGAIPFSVGELVVIARKLELQLTELLPSE